MSTPKETNTSIPQQQAPDHDLNSRHLAIAPRRFPQPGELRGIVAIVALVGGILVIVFLAVLVIAQARNGKTVGTGGTSCPQGHVCGTPISINGSVWLDPVVVGDVKSQVPAGLNLSATQVQTKLQSGLHITNLAQQQGISLDQLHALELKAVQAGMNTLVQEGKATQSDADALIQDWKAHPDKMDSNVEMMFALVCQSATCQ